MNADRLDYLITQIKSGNASKEERDEYISWLHKEKKIREEDYNYYQKGIDTDKIMKYGLLAGLGTLAIMLIAALVAKK